jgi:signal transduction histidine kinase
MIAAAPAFAGWSLALTMSALCAGLALRAARRRLALNEALHELRRPLQAIALSSSSPPFAPAGLESSVQLAGAALQRLDREVNGGGPLSRTETVRCERVLRSAVGRWRARVALSGGSLELRWRAGGATLSGDARAIEQAVDNLIVNAVEHGGAAIVVDAAVRRGLLVISVRDSGRGPGGGGSAAQVRQHAIATLSGRKRRGHGLSVARRVAAEHGGRLVTRFAEAGSVAVLELPLPAEAGTGPAA